MTLLPVEPARVKVADDYSWCSGPELPRWCQVPTCGSSLGLETHHIYPRSRTGGPRDFITVDGLVRQNVCMLCKIHHDQATGLVGGHRAAIRLAEWEGRECWVWFQRMSAFDPVALSRRGDHVVKLKSGAVLAAFGPLVTDLHSIDR